MEVVSWICEIVHDYKENIVPSSNAAATSFSVKSKVTPKNKKKRRQPLRDITHQFINHLSTSTTPIVHLQNFHPAAPSAQIPASSGFNLRKRNAPDSTQDTVSKSLRMNFR
ncbi:hypothetical protein POM88_004854 [Heracleum sosnowskyi]|uniref:Uncharacterized protein n=1 Tax=Heracleum sosnowskyi TaxID=360622 RepID=A0AAD8JJ59_9APIA|nr:hypothetical protein POM88_004854 [Heracleum sosnowskyi]